jgi:hypothetical protein
VQGGNVLPSSLRIPAIAVLIAVALFLVNARSGDSHEIDLGGGTATADTTYDVVRVSR